MRKAQWEGLLAIRKDGDTGGSRRAARRESSLATDSGGHLPELQLLCVSGKDSGAHPAYFTT